MKTALDLGHELAGESQQAITEALEAWSREVKAAALREAAQALGITGYDRVGEACITVLRMAERAERGE